MNCEIKDCHLKGEIHHILTRRRHGKLAELKENKIFLCRLHHIEVHSTGIDTFARKHGLTKRFEAAKQAVWQAERENSLVVEIS